MWITNGPDADVIVRRLTLILYVKNIYLIKKKKKGSLRQNRAKGRVKRYHCLHPRERNEGLLHGPKAG
jgi:hypothetical protein